MDVLVVSLAYPQFIHKTNAMKMFSKQCKTIFFTEVVHIERNSSRIKDKHLG